MRDRKKIITHAFAVAESDDTLDYSRIAPFTDEGRCELIRTLNRPSGERVVHVRITEHR